MSRPQIPALVIVTLALACGASSTTSSTSEAGATSVEAGAAMALGDGPRASLTAPDAGGGAGGAGGRAGDAGGGGAGGGAPPPPPPPAGGAGGSVDAGALAVLDAALADAPQADARGGEDLGPNLWRTEAGQLGCATDTITSDPCPGAFQKCVSTPAPEPGRPYLRKGLCCACNQGGACAQVGEQCGPTAPGNYCTAYHPVNITQWDVQCLPRGCDGTASSEGARCYEADGLGTCQGKTCVVTCKYSDPCTH